MRRVIRGLAWLAGLLALAGCGSYLWNSRGAGPGPRDEAALRIASHNVHYIVLSKETGPWSVGDWDSRKHSVDGAFKALDADLVAFQEMESFRFGGDGRANLVRDWLIAENPGYGLAAHGDAPVFPITQPILYRRDRLSLRDQGWFFFSDTPDVIYAPTYNGSWSAFTSWAEFETRAGQDTQVFRVYNVHTDFSSAENRARSAELIRERVAPVVASGMPVIVLGDLNVLHGWQVMEVIADAGVDFAKTPGATYHLDRGLNLFGAIDHIGMTPHFTVQSGPFVLRDKFAGDWPSDHYPIGVDVVLR